MIVLNPATAESMFGTAMAQTANVSKLTEIAISPVSEIFIILYCLFFAQTSMRRFCRWAITVFVSLSSLTTLYHPNFLGTNQLNVNQLNCQVAVDGSTRPNFMTKISRDTCYSLHHQDPAGCSLNPAAEGESGIEPGERGADMDETSKMRAAWGAEA
jgi:hypothetical protein